MDSPTRQTHAIKTSHGFGSSGLKSPEDNLSWGFRGKRDFFRRPATVSSEFGVKCSTIAQWIPGKPRVVEEPGALVRSGLVELEPLGLPATSWELPGWFGWCIMTSFTGWRSSEGTLTKDEANGHSRHRCFI